MSDSEKMSDAEAYAAITDTILNYAEYVDGGEIELWAELFCQDAVFDEGQAVTGRPAIQALLPKLLRLFTATAHHVSNIRIERTASARAKATSYVHAWHRKLDGSDFEFWGRYVDVFAFEENAWRFSSRRIEQFGARGLEIKVDQVPRREPEIS
jgi:3-phenylpropionate/cinnamic acid dioxygenase small subunit